MAKNKSVKITNQLKYVKKRILGEEDLFRRTLREERLERDVTQKTLREVDLSQKAQKDAIQRTLREGDLERDATQRIQRELDLNQKIVIKELNAIKKFAAMVKTAICNAAEMKKENKLLKLSLPK